MSKKLNILFLSSWYPSRVNKSNGDFVQRHAEAIATKHNVSIIHIITDKELKKSKEVVSENLNNVTTKIVYINQIKNSVIRNVIFIKNYLKQIKALENIDIIHVNITYPIGIIAFYTKLTKKIPYIITEHSTEYQNYNSKKNGSIKNYLLKKIFKKASKICPVSVNLKESMIKLGFNGSYRVVPNVVNTSVFKPKKSNSFVITHISHMRNEHKNVKGILNVFAKLQLKIPNVTFYLIGNGSSKYKNIIKDLNIKNIYLTEQIPHHLIPNYLNQSNLLVLFSNYENLPCVILEAFSCGVPVISTDVGGIKEFFPSNFGYLINRMDEEAFEKSILKIYQSDLIVNKKLMHYYAKYNFGIDKISASYTKIYNKILNN